MSDDNPPADHVIEENNDSGIPIEEHVKSRSTWLRLVFMIVFYALATVASAVCSVVIVLGFFWVLFTGEKNHQLQRAGQAIAAYIAEIILYLSYNTDERPFPFDKDFPAAEATQSDRAPD